MKILTLSKKEFMDIVTEKVYLLAFLVQMVMVIGIIYTALLYTSVTSPGSASGGFVQTQVPKVGVVGGIDLELKGLKTIRIESRDHDYAQVLRRWDLVALVAAPLTFQQDIEEGKDVEILLLLDNTNVLSGYADATITEAVERLSRQIKKERISKFGDPEAILAPVYIEKVIVGEEREVLFDSPKFIELMYGFLLPFILLLPTFLAMNMTTDSIVGEKERKTYEILVSIPITKRGIILGKILPILFISDLQALAWILILHVKGIVVYNVPLIILFLSLLNLSFIGVGIIISAFSENIKDADIGVTLSIIVFSLVFFAPLSLTKEIYKLSPVAVLSKLASNPAVALDKVAAVYLFLLASGVAVVYFGGRMLEWKENLRL
jgi:ABC-2 type transport system permease protein